MDGVAHPRRSDIDTYYAQLIHGLLTGLLGPRLSSLSEHLICLFHTSRFAIPRHCDNEGFSRHFHKVWQVGQKYTFPPMYAALSTVVPQPGQGFPKPFLLMLVV